MWHYGAIFSYLRQQQEYEEALRRGDIKEPTQKESDTSFITALFILFIVAGGLITAMIKLNT